MSKALKELINLIEETHSGSDEWQCLGHSEGQACCIDLIRNSPDFLAVKALEDKPSE